MSAVQVMLLLLDVYLVFGAVIGVIYSFGFAERAAGLDPGSLPTRVRILLIPGSLAVWPLLLARIARGHSGGWAGGTS